MKAKYLLKGVFKSIPGIEKVYNFHKSTGGTDSARYCYAVWMRHLVLAHENSSKGVPRKIAELGPGDSVGIGLSALLSGAERYYALDVVRYTNVDCNLKIFDELTTLFRNKTPIPQESEFPNIRPALKCYEFPSHILSDEHMERALHDDRVKNIRKAISVMDQEALPDSAMISYRVPWDTDKVIEKDSVDMIISQAVLQHVNDLEGTYKAMHKWLKKDGLMSHSIDLKSMGSSDSWDGHWSYSDLEWKIVKGRKDYLINREPHSTHIQHIEDNGFTLVCDKRTESEPTLKLETDVAKRFRSLSDKDRSISGTFIQAIKQFLVSMCVFGEELLLYIASV